jgi:hypothetical protein
MISIGIGESELLSGTQQVALRDGFLPLEMPRVKVIPFRRFKVLPLGPNKVLVPFLLEVAPANTATREADTLNEAEGIAEKARYFRGRSQRESRQEERVKGTHRATKFPCRRCRAQLSVLSKSAVPGRHLFPAPAERTRWLGF